MMKNIATRFLSVLCGMAVMLAMAAGFTSVSASAASNGIYIATATPHYRHPTTGVIEDSGGEKSEVLGQSMTESATHSQALVEVDENGNTFVTVRLKLMDNIENPTFQVDGSDVSSTLMQEDYNENTADYRMQVNSENSIIRCTMYVVPMGRSVIFFITVSDLQEGSGDFITSITVKKADNSSSNNADKGSSVNSNNNSNNNSDNNSANRAANSAADSNSEAKAAATTVKTTTAPVTAAPQTTAQPTTAAPSTAVTQSSTAETKSVGIQVFDAQGNEEVQTTAAATVDESGSGSGIAWIVIGAVVVAAGAGFCVWYFGFFKKKAKGTVESDVNAEDNADAVNTDNKADEQDNSKDE